MPFIPHTSDDIEQMLAVIGVDNIDDLFSEVPEQLKGVDFSDLPQGLTELDVSQLLKQRAKQDSYNLSFLGAGAYEHYIPAAVWQIASRGEFYSAYTPYQAEASQGILQLIYEYQSMMAKLTAMDASNASLYDGASALAEAILMAVRCHRRSKSKSNKILIAGSLHPHYSQVANSIVAHQGIEIVQLAYDVHTGKFDNNALAAYQDQDITAVVIPQPNFFGVLESVDEITNWAHQHKSLVIAVVNPMAMALLKPAGEWGDKGADIVCGEGQPFGIPLSLGGPYFGFLCCQKPYLRQLPGRIVGRTVDQQGKIAYTLTLQAREQHIRRAKATSNICTNQGLMVTAATIYMALMGDQGLINTAGTCHQRTRQLVEQLTAIDGIDLKFASPFFHEAVLAFQFPLQVIMRALQAQGIIAGLVLAEFYPKLENCLLVCATETKTEQDITQYVAHVKRIIEQQAINPCPVQAKS